FCIFHISYLTLISDLFTIPPSVLHTDADNKLVFIRAADPHTLEYISAENADAVKNGNYIGMIHRISLE
ncbi:MAG: hypothetical protein K2N94_15290, partial [Lachnospiraceae bacterium]|nr:hypothetical protein [Lachnospiraceae bacterium]